MARGTSSGCVTVMAGVQAVAAPADDEHGHYEADDYSSALSDEHFCAHFRLLLEGIQRRRKLASTNSDANSLVQTSHRSSGQRVAPVAWGSSFRDSTGTHIGVRRVEEEDARASGAMKIGPWVATKRKALWQAGFAVAVALKLQCPHDESP